MHSPWFRCAQLCPFLGHRGMASVAEINGARVPLACPLDGNPSFMRCRNCETARATSRSMPERGHFGDDPQTPRGGAAERGSRLTGAPCPAGPKALQQQTSLCPPHPFRRSRYTPRPPRDPDETTPSYGRNSVSNRCRKWIEHEATRLRPPPTRDFMT